MTRSTFVATTIALLAFASPAAADPAGAIDGGTANADWTQGQVDNMTVVFDLCGNDGASDCQWTALATVQAASAGSCAQNPFASPDAKLFWASEKQSANATVHSGPLTFQTNGGYGQRVCLYYWRHFTESGVDGYYVVFSKLLEPPPPPPAPTPEPTPTPAPAPTPTPSPGLAPSVSPKCVAAKKAETKDKVAMHRALKAYKRHRTPARRRAWRRAVARLNRAKGAATALCS